MEPKAPYAESGRSSPAPSKIAGYERYLAQGPTPEIEMTRLDIPDNQPLLNQVCTLSAEPTALAHANHGDLDSGLLRPYGRK